MINLSDIITEAIYQPTYLPLVQKEVCSPGSWGEVDKKLRLRADNGTEGGTKKLAKLRMKEQQEHTYSGSKNYSDTSTCENC